MDRLHRWGEGILVLAWKLFLVLALALLAAMKSLAAARVFSAFHRYIPVLVVTPPGPVRQRSGL
jgi:hypothetical protein